MTDAAQATPPIGATVVIDRGAIDDLLAGISQRTNLNSFGRSVWSIITIELELSSHSIVL
ncbi:MAG: hypothetical protein ACLQA5_21610 [Solirubrobacteraceae bacterium]